LNYYVYYKLASGAEEQSRAAVASLFSLIEKQCGVRGRWMRRRDDPSTYMEVYEGVQDEAAFEALLEREGARLGVPRKLERFVCV
jgi:hypothetical protein